MSDFEQFKASIPNCHCHCRECCECDRPIHYLSISEELRKDPRFTDQLFRECVHIMEIPGATGIFTTHKEVEHG